MNVKLSVMALLASSFFYGGAAMAQEGEKAKPILGVITHDELLQGKIAYKTKSGYAITFLKEPEVGRQLITTAIPYPRAIAAPSRLSWVSDEVILFKEESSKKSALWAMTIPENKVMQIASGLVRSIHGLTKDSAIAIMADENILVSNHNSNLKITRLGKSLDQLINNGNYLAENAECARVHLQYDYKLSSARQTVCTTAVYSEFAKKYIIKKGTAEELPRVKNAMLWQFIQKNFFLDAVRSPNGGFYFKGGILHEPLYRDGLEVWEPLTEEPTKSFTPVWGMRVRGGAILADAIKSDKGVCGKEGFSQAYWLKTQKGEQLLHVNTKNSYLHTGGVSPDGCKVTVWDFSNNHPNCENNKAELVILDICAIQK